MILPTSLFGETSRFLNGPKVLICSKWQQFSCDHLRKLQKMLNQSRDPVPKSILCGPLVGTKLQGPKSNKP